jgi:chromosome partitioning protein
MGKVLAIVNLKGGSGKTTVTMGLASALPGAIVIDTDRQGSSWKWGQAAADAFTVTEPVTEPGPALGALLAPVRKDGRWVLIDTPPGHPEVTAEALRAADEALIRMGPSPVEVAQLAATLTLIAATRPDLPVLILLNRVKPHTLLAAGVRAILAEDDLPVMDAEIADREAYPHPVTEPVTEPEGGVSVPAP